MRDSSPRAQRRRADRGPGRCAQRDREDAHRSGVDTPSLRNQVSRRRARSPIKGAMELRARIQPLPRRTAMMAACAALLVTALVATIAPPDADASKAPTVTKVAPLDVAVGEKLTIRGRNFIQGRKKTTVVFRRDGGRAVS